MRTHTDLTWFDCVVCGKAVSSKDGLKAHMDRHAAAQSGQRPFVCETCGASFADKAGLRVHENAHAAEKPFGCYMCSVRFTFRSNAYRHMRNHADADLRQFSCDICGKMLKTKGGLKVHTAAHLAAQSGQVANPPGKKFSCGTCGEKFAFPTNLDRHVKQHHQAREMGPEEAV
jgi:uncharacterized Zn-finger protein